MHVTKSTDKSPLSNAKQSPVVSISTKIPLSESSLARLELKNTEFQISPSLYETTRKPEFKIGPLNFSKTAARGQNTSEGYVKGRKILKITGYKRDLRKLEDSPLNGQLKGDGKNEKPSRSSKFDSVSSVISLEQRPMLNSSHKRGPIDDETSPCRRGPKVQIKHRRSPDVTTVSFSSRRQTRKFIYILNEEKKILFNIPTQNKLHRHSNDDDCDTDDEQVIQATRICTRDFIVALNAATSEVRPNLPANNRSSEMMMLTLVDGGQNKKPIA
jgi:hypothetical protein